MNRRELIQSCISALSAAGVQAEVTDVPADPPLLMIVIRTPERQFVSVQASIRKSEQITRVAGDLKRTLRERLGYDIPILFVNDGTTIEAVVAPSEVGVKG